MLGGVLRDIVNKRNAEVRCSLAREDIKARISALGAEVATATPEQVVEFICAEIAKWEKASGYFLLP